MPYSYRNDSPAFPAAAMQKYSEEDTVAFYLQKATSLLEKCHLMLDGCNLKHSDVYHDLRCKCEHISQFIVMGMVRSGTTLAARICSEQAESLHEKLTLEARTGPYNLQLTPPEQDQYRSPYIPRVPHPSPHHYTSIDTPARRVLPPRPAHMNIDDNLVHHRNGHEAISASVIRQGGVYINKAYINLGNANGAGCSYQSSGWLRPLQIQSPSRSHADPYEHGQGCPLIFDQNGPSNSEVGNNRAPDSPGQLSPLLLPPSLRRL
ncbi:hypothetical protein SERLA73DRAFT_73897 [Serpula lacrymans var. lacrymans S7.3]|uniref:Uncharacterized protein n=1 Tax=Serpula lacrymans var. lacrymans (strain S7.3) TaxID=936435 RepID=F8PX92_SERL3|nr:hypothetical protein SERLA73DRAFT_73897 [Serpula lacrymans var. lacrymans S7.3]